MHPASLDYLQTRPRDGGALRVLQSLGQVLAEQVPVARAARLPGDADLPGNLLPGNLAPRDLW